jgi:hypothetical protein
LRRRRVLVVDRLADVKKRIEPEILRRGKEFHRLVQKDWEVSARDGSIHAEHAIALLPRSDRVRRQRQGRLDIFVDELGSFVTVVEIKGTDWDRVKASNRRRLVAKHRRQVWRYMEKYLDEDGLDVCGGIIYPRSPSEPGLKALVEDHLNDWGLQVVWYEDE